MILIIINMSLMVLMIIILHDGGHYPQILMGYAVMQTSKGDTSNTHFIVVVIVTCGM
jgi:hypothetical protein